MRRISWSVVSLLALGISLGTALPGCGSDDDNSAANNSTGGTTASTGGDDAGTTGSGTTADGGTTGAKGDGGTTGTTGDAGSTGAKGDAGTTGATGDAGTTGAQGDAGTTGATSDGGSTSDGGTGTATDGGGDAGITFAQVSGIFKRCTGCHSSTTPDGGTRKPSGSLDLTGAGGAYGALVGKQAAFCSDEQYVNPGHPETSYLIAAVTGDFPAETATCTNNHVDGGKPMTRMPLNCIPVGPDGGPLSSPDSGTPDGEAAADSSTPVDASVESLDASGDVDMATDAANTSDSGLLEASVGDGGTRAPIPCLTDEEVQLLKDWIAAGAQQ